MNNIISEKQVESRLNFEVKKLNGISIKLLPFHYAGLPDRIILLPMGVLYFVEVKKPKGGKVSPVQKYVHEQFLKIGFKVRIICNYDQINELINEYKNTQKC